jgi:hypothetical protein
MVIAGTTYNKFTVWGMNRWGTSVGAFKDSSGKMHGSHNIRDRSAVNPAPHNAANTIRRSIGLSVHFMERREAAYLQPDLQGGSLGSCSEAAEHG